MGAQQRVGGIMVVRQSLLFISVLITLLVLPLALADTCIFQTGADYSCYDGATYTPEPPYTTFQDWCIGNGGSYYNEDPEQRDECIEVCCCDDTDPYTPYSDWPISKLTCDEFGHPFFSVYEEPPSTDCVETCSGYAGTPPRDAETWTVEGSVLDTNSQTLEGVRVWYLGGGSVYENYTDAQGNYKIHRVPEGTHTFRAERSDCQPSEVTREVTSDTMVDFVGQDALDCSSGLCTPDPVSGTQASIVNLGDNSVTITWSETTCSPRGYNVIRKRKTNYGTIIGSLNLGFIPAGSPTSFIDRDAPTYPPTSYKYETCYEIETVARSGQRIQQERPAEDTHCVPVMSRSCIENFIPEDDPQCFNSNTEFRPLIPPSPPSPFTGEGYCDNTNRAFGSECQAGSFCSQAAGTPECVTTTSCDECNSIFGLFFDPLEVVEGEACGLKPVCTLNTNNANHSMEVLESCGLISSCFDYRSPTACTDNNCSVGGGCQWRNVDGLEEFGLGVCAPIAGTGECERCADFGSLCDAALCSTYGPDCYFNANDATGSEELGCLSKERMACRYYDTRADCVGSRPNARNYDITHEPTEEGVQRTGVTNALLDPSEDPLGFHKCVWVSTDAEDPEAGYCIKDSDDWRPEAPLTGELQDDCEERGTPSHRCFADNSSPRTIVPLIPHSYVSFEQFKQTPISVVDGNESLPESNARFCLLPTTSATGEPPCYPDQPFTNLVPEEEDEYSLVWYAFDPAGNLEEVQEMVLNIYEPSTAVLINATLVYR